MEERPVAAVHDVELELDGIRYFGSYSVESDLVTVVYGLSRKSTQVGNSPTEGTAGILLRELVEQSLQDR